MHNIHVAIRSRGRAGRVTSHRIFPDAFIWAPESEQEDYRKHHGDKIMIVPDKCDGNLGVKSNAILDNSPSKWTLIVDDDVTSIHCFDYGKDKTLSPSECIELVKHGFDIASQLGVKLWGINQNSNEMAYASFRPFNLLAPILGPFTGHLSPVLRYDPSVHGKDDYDFWLQNIAKYHRTFRMNKYHYIHDHGTKPGGFVAMRTKDLEQKGIDRMKAKWGTKVFKVGGSPGARRNRQVNKDGNILNSMVRVPIDGC